MLDFSRNMRNKWISGPVKTFKLRQSPMLDDFQYKFEVVMYGFLRTMI